MEPDPLGALRQRLRQHRLDLQAQVDRYDSGRQAQVRSRVRAAKPEPLQGPPLDLDSHQNSTREKFLDSGRAAG